MKKCLHLLDAFAGALETKKVLNISWWKLIRSGLSTAKSEGGLSLRDQMHYAAQSAKFNRLIFDGFVKSRLSR